MTIESGNQSSHFRSNLGGQAITDLSQALSLSE